MEKNASLKISIILEETVRIT